MSWGWFWVCAFLLVLVLIVGSKLGATRGWAGRVFGRVLPDVSGWGRALSGVLGSHWVKLAAIPLVIGAIWGVVSYVEGRGALKEQIKAERANTQAAEFETAIAGKALVAAEETHAITHAARDAARQGQQDIDNAVASLPPVVTQDHFAELDRIYRDAYLRVLGISEPGNPRESDPHQGRSAPVRGARPDAA